MQKQILGRKNSLINIARFNITKNQFLIITQITCQICSNHIFPFFKNLL